MENETNENLGKDNTLSLDGTKLIGVNESEMEKLIENIQTIQDNLLQTFDDMNSLVSGTAEYFKDPVGDDLRLKYENIKSMYPKIIQGIDNFKDDFINTKNNYVVFEEKVGVSDVEAAPESEVNTGVQN